MKIYDLVHELLIKDVSLRNSDLKLIWAVLEKTGKVRNNFISYTNFGIKGAEAPLTNLLLHRSL